MHRPRNSSQPIDPTYAFPRELESCRARLNIPDVLAISCHLLRIQTLIMPNGPKCDSTCTAPTTPAPTTPAPTTPASTTPAPTTPRETLKLISIFRQKLPSSAIGKIGALLGACRRAIHAGRQIRSHTLSDTWTKCSKSVSPPPAGGGRLRHLPCSLPHTRLVVLAVTMMLVVMVEAIAQSVTYLAT